MTLLILCIPFAILSVFSVVCDNSHFDAFKANHNRSYGSLAEELHRRSIFDTNYKNALKHNMEAAAGIHSYTMDWSSQFADKTPSEVHKGCYLSSFTPHNNNSLTFMVPANVDLLKEIDWRKLGAVTPVKTQGQCGSCWAFSVTGTLEGMWFRKTGQLVSLSEQQLVDCTNDYNKYYNLGCDGGMTDRALQYIRDNNGIDTEEFYPYEAKDGKCHFSKDKVGATNGDVVYIKRASEEDLMAAVATVGPISVGIEGANPKFVHYKSGVFYNPDGSVLLDHAVLVVGYGHDEPSGMDYWLVKNSWGAEWGEEGYVRIARNKKNHLGIASFAVYPLV